MKLSKKNVASDKNGIFYAIPSCGHVANVDSTDEFNKIFLEFLKYGAIYEKDNVNQIDCNIETEL